MNRREFLFLAASAAVGAGAAATRPTTSSAPTVMTVHGPVRAAALGVTLSHEHVLVDFIGADRATPDRYDHDEVVRVVLPHLKRAAELGCRTIIECTPAHLGRDPLLLGRLARESGIAFVTNTGYYGAGPDFKFLPAHARTETAEQLAERWTREFEHGIGETGIRPGFIKIGVNKAPLHELHRKLVRAAALTHLRTGLTLAAHTGDGAAAIEELSILREAGVSPAALVWVHAQNERDPALRARVAEAGAWLSFDGIDRGTLQRHVDLVTTAKVRGNLGRVLVSHDAGWYRPGEPGGGTFRPFDTLFTEFLPALRRAGVADDEICLLTTTNPADAFALRVRRR